MREAHVPAQQSEAQQDPRLPPPYADQGRPSGDPEPSSAGPQASRGLIWPVRDRATFESFAQARARKSGPVRIRQVRGSPGPPRVAYAIGRRAGNAVARNRLRRRLRAAMRDQVDLLEPGSAYLVSAEPHAATMSYVALSEAIGRRARLPKDPSRCRTGPAARRGVADPGLAPGERLVAAPLPVLPVVLGLRPRGARAPRRSSRYLACVSPGFPVPPMARGRDRPRP